MALNMARTKTLQTRISKKTTNLSPTQDSRRIQGGKSPVASRFKPGSLALKEIRKYQKSSDLLLRKRPFQRLLRSLIPPSDEFRFQSASVNIFQEAFENFMTNVLEDAYKCALHAKRVTLLPRDIILVYKIKYSKSINTMMI